MSDIVQRIMKLKRSFDEAEQEKHRAEGRLQSLMEALKTKHGCESLEEAEAKLKKLVDEEMQLRERLEDGLDDLEATFGMGE